MKNIQDMGISYFERNLFRVALFRKLLRKKSDSYLKNGTCPRYWLIHVILENKFPKSDMESILTPYPDLFKFNYYYLPKF